MACTVCGSGVPCGCQRAGNVSLNNLASSGQCGPRDCCGPTTCPAPTPYYGCADASPQSHCQKIVIENFAADLKIVNTWAIPSCGGSVTVSIPGLKAINVGSYLWNATYGYFEVTAFNAATQEVSIKNNCTDGNSSVGTTVPACTEFTVTVPPPPSQDITDICVAIDFTAPDVDDCVDITLTDTTGLTVGDTIQIGTGFYFLEAIKPNNVVSICNRGEGITPGTAVIAKDADGNYQYCISVISTNPCDRSEVSEAVALGCADGIISPIDVHGAGWFLMGISEITNEAQYAPVGLPPSCTKIASAFFVSIGVSNYSVVVDSTADFTVGDILTMSGTGLRFEVTNIPDSTHFDVTTTTVPVADLTITVGSFVCRIGCCELLQNEIDDIVTCPQAIVGIAPVALQFFNVPITITPGMGNQYQENVLTVDLGSITIGESCSSSINLFALLNVQILSDWDGLVGNVPPYSAHIMHEVWATWLPKTAPYVGGRFTCVETLSDGFIDSGSYPATTEPAIWGLLQLAGSSRLPNNYHGGDITAFKNVNAPGTYHLQLNYNTVLGEFFNSVVYDQVEIMVSGVIYAMSDTQP